MLLGDLSENARNLICLKLIEILANSVDKESALGRIVWIQKRKGNPMNKRSYFRLKVYQTKVKVSYLSPERSYLYITKMRDISGNGISVHSEVTFERIQIGDEVTISFSMQGETFRLRAKVVRGDLKEERNNIYAFQYVLLDPQTEERLMKLLLQADIQRNLQTE